jgi:alkanesulfonate monooxygenase SsuD/methylene tetrahydromethanopterin reductase-like flavin-dependent oxidoreductase (luciferase family)
VWFGGKFTERNIKRIVELGDGWMPYGGLRMTLAQKADATAVLRERYAAAGRDPSTLDVCDGLREVDASLERSLEEIPAMARAGVTVVRVHLRRFAPTPADVVPLVERIVRLFEPYRALNV